MLERIFFVLMSCLSFPGDIDTNLVRMKPPDIGNQCAFPVVGKIVLQ